MKELIAFVQSKKEKGLVKLVPLFYKLTPDDLKPRVQDKGLLVRGSKLPVRNRRVEIPQLLGADPRQHGRSEEKVGGMVNGSWEEWTKDWNAWVETDKTKLVINEELCNEAIKELKYHNGLKLERSGKSEYEFRKRAREAIMNLSPPAIPFDTSDIWGCDRLCKAISDMFVDKQGVHYLGLHGSEGSGKSTISCEAMCSFFQNEFHGRFCRVQLEFEDAAVSKSAAAKKRETRLRQAIQLLFGLDKKMSAITTEPQLRSYLNDKLRSQPVFLVVDNVSQSSREEAEYFLKAVVAEGSKVLVTSRSPKILEAVLGGAQYCQPIPGLEQEEAEKLVLSKAAYRKLNSLEQDELEILEQCVAEVCPDEQYYPLMLRNLASYLQGSGENDIRSWEQNIEVLRHSKAGKAIYGLSLLQYDKLDKTSKLVFLDLAIFVGGMCLAHEDFHLQFEQYSFEQAVTYIALLHGIRVQQAKTKVKNLQGTPFLDSGDTNISMPESIMNFARWLIMRDGDRVEKDWYMVCARGEEEEDVQEDVQLDQEQIFEFANLPNVFPSTLVRVRTSRFSLAYSDHLKIEQWRHVAYLELIQVTYLRCLDLQGLYSLRVLRVEECRDLEKIVCTCGHSSLSDGHFCYENQSPSGCMSNLRFVQLVFLNRLKYALFPMHCWNLETLWFFACPNMSCLPDLRFCKKLKKLRLPCGDFQNFRGLSSNLALTELAFHWEPMNVRNFTEDMRKTLLVDMMNLTNLTVLDIVDEREVYEWIPAGIRTLNVRKLVHLTFLDLSYATTIEQLEGLEQLSQLTSLGLYGCCELRTLPHLALFRSLKRLCIGHCHNLALTREHEVPWEIENFHPVGEMCSFGEHECLDPCDNFFGICTVCEPAPIEPYVQQARNAEDEQQPLEDEDEEFQLLKVEVEEQAPQEEDHEEQAVEEEEDKEQVVEGEDEEQAVEEEEKEQATPEEEEQAASEEDDEGYGNQSSRSWW